jgi:hypothetical protein
LLDDLPLGTFKENGFRARMTPVIFLGDHPFDNRCKEPKKGRENVDIKD